MRADSDAPHYISNLGVGVFRLAIEYAAHYNSAS